MACRCGIQYMADLIIEFLKDYGYWGMGIMAFLAGTVLPITSEVLLLFFLGVGLNAVGLVLAATVGNTIGGITCFMIGYLTTKEKVQKFFKVSDRRMKRADILIQKYGYWTAAFSFLPVLGEVFLLSLGVMRVNRMKVIVLMAAGKLFRYAFVVISAIGIAKFFGY